MDKKRIISILSLGFFFINILSACTAKDTKNNNVDLPQDLKTQASYSHGVINPDPESGVIEYYGSSIEIQYEIENFGDDLNVGLFLFINGIIHPYRTYGNEYKQMHVFDIDKKGRLIIDIDFIPEFGIAGNEYSLIFATIYNPNVVAENNGNYTYGNDHNLSFTLPWKLIFNESSPKNNERPFSVSNQEYNEYDLSQEYIKKNSRNSSETDLRDLETVLRINEKSDAFITIDKDEEVYADIEVFGKITNDVRTAILINHVPINVFNEECYIEWPIKLNTINHIKVPIKNLNPGKYVIYVLSLPFTNNSTNIDVDVNKTNSITLTII